MKYLLIRHKKLLVTLSVIFVLAIGAYLRLYKISEYMTFLGDEGRDVMVVKRMIIDHQFTLLGPTASVGGFFLGPIYYYFMIPFLWAWNLDPSGPAYMVAFFGIGTIYLVYQVGKDMFSELVGLIASSLYAVSPLVIAYSRSSWNPNLVPFFSLLAIYLSWRVIVKKRFFELFWIGVTFGIGLQLHYLFLFLIFVIGAWFFCYGRSIPWKYYVCGVAGLVLGYAPFLAFEIRHGFPNTQSIIRFVLEGKDTGFTWNLFLTNQSQALFRLFGRLVFRIPETHMLNGLPQWQFIAWVTTTRTAILTSIAYLLYNCFGVMRSLTQHNKKKSISIITVQQQSTILLTLWLFGTVVLFGLYRRAIYDYYFGIIFTLPFILTGLVLYQLFQWPKLAWIAVLFWFGILYINWQGRPFLYEPNNQLEQTKRIAAAALNKTGGKPFNFALVANFNSDHAYRYFFEIWGNKPVVIENIAVDPQRKSVTNQLIVICEILDCKPLGHSLWEIAGFGRAEIESTMEVPFVKIMKLVHYKENM